MKAPVQNRLSARLFPTRLEDLPSPRSTAEPGPPGAASGKQPGTWPAVQGSWQDKAYILSLTYICGSRLGRNSCGLSICFLAYRICALHVSMCRVTMRKTVTGGQRGAGTGALNCTLGPLHVVKQTNPPALRRWRSARRREGGQDRNSGRARGTPRRRRAPAESGLREEDAVR